MSIQHMFHYIKQLSGRLGSNVYASVQDQSNPMHLSFIRQLQREKKEENHLRIPLAKLPVVVFDLETTGFYADRGDRILSIGAVKMIGSKIDEEKTFYSLVKTEQEVPPRILELTGLKKEELQIAPALSNVLVRFYQYFGHHLLVAHHAQHEKDFMQMATWDLYKIRFQKRIVDTSFLVKVAEPQLHLNHLEDLCRHCGIQIGQRHHALADAKMAAYLWGYYSERIQGLGYTTLADIYEELARYG